MILVKPVHNSIAASSFVKLCFISLQNKLRMIYYYCFNDL